MSQTVFFLLPAFSVQTKAGPGGAEPASGCGQGGRKRPIRWASASEHFQRLFGQAASEGRPTGFHGRPDFVVFRGCFFNYEGFGFEWNGKCVITNASSFDS